ncbi:MAG: TetR/AcrR family transcriptional regulator [Proteobacteria bacterium]|nr:TetR/AcrR family transcriptional regulator [Pseudomonadota bacterium]
MLTMGETASLGNASPKAKRPKGKKKETRDRILEAATLVFSRHPYQNAGLRMISKLAEVDQPLINYYFGSKADLFRAVLSRMIEQRRELQKTWFAVAKPMGAERGFSLFLDNLLEDYRRRPGLFHVISLNFPQNHENPIPGYDLIEDFIQSDVGLMKENLGVNVADHEREMFIRAMSTLLLGFLGRAKGHAKMMGMEPDSIVYFNWVRDTVLFTVLPRFKEMTKESSSSKGRLKD